VVERRDVLRPGVGIEEGKLRPVEKVWVAATFEPRAG